MFQITKKRRRKIKVIYFFLKVYKNQKKINNWSLIVFPYKHMDIKIWTVEKRKQDLFKFI